MGTSHKAPVSANRAIYPRMAQNPLLGTLTEEGLEFLPDNTAGAQSKVQRGNKLCPTFHPGPPTARE